MGSLHSLHKFLPKQAEVSFPLRPSFSLNNDFISTPARKHVVDTSSQTGNMILNVFLNRVTGQLPSLSSDSYIEVNQQEKLQPKLSARIKLNIISSFPPTVPGPLLLPCKIVKNGSTRSFSQIPNREKLRVPLDTEFNARGGKSRKGPDTKDHQGHYRGQKPRGTGSCHAASAVL